MGHHFYPPWLDPFKCGMCFGLKVAAASNFAQVLFNNNDTMRYAVVLDVNHVAPAGGDVDYFLVAGIPSGYTLFTNAVSIVSDEQNPNLNVYTNNTTSAPTFPMYSTGISNSQSSPWPHDFPMFVLKPTWSLLCASNVVNTNGQVGIYFAMLTPDELMGWQRGDAFRKHIDDPNEIDIKIRG